MIFLLAGGVNLSAQNACCATGSKAKTTFETKDTQVLVEKKSPHQGKDKIVSLAFTLF